MLRKRITVTGAASVAFLLLFVSAASGYELCGYDWTYMENPMGEDYRVNANCRDLDGEELDAVRAAAVEWNTTGGADFLFTYGGKCRARRVSYNGKNEIMWVNQNTGSVATTYIWIGTGEYSTRIYECDMVFNDWSYRWAVDGSSNAMDVQNVATHELGHFLCLGDLYGSGDTEKTMYGYVNYGETKKRSLHSDDIAGIQAIYGLAPPPGIMHVQSIDMRLKQKGPWANAIAKVKIVDDDDVAVAQATVYGSWSGLTGDSDVFDTDADGFGECSSDKLKDPSGCFVFTVDNVTKAGWDYDPDENVETSDEICTGSDGGQSAGIGPAHCTSFALFASQPNPFKGRTTIRFILPGKTRAILMVHDVTGRTITTLVDEELTGGTHTVVWDGHAGSGLYFYRLTAGDSVATRKMIVLR